MAAQTTAVPAERNMLDRYFKVTEAGSTIGTEVRGGLTNFLVMSYILVVNAVILSSAGMSFPAVAAATALLAALFTGGMALWANYPYAGAAGLGINAVVAFGLVKGAGLSWQAAMGVVALEGGAICIAMALGLRRALLDAVPYQLKLGIGAGIGAFIFAIGAFNGGLAMGTGNASDPVALGNLRSLREPEPLPERNARFDGVHHDHGGQLLHRALLHGPHGWSLLRLKCWSRS